MIYLLAILSLSSITLIQSLSTNPQPSPSFLIIGGTGRIGTAVASHLLHRLPPSTITLAGRDIQRGQNAINEVLSEQPTSSPAKVSFRQVDYKDMSSLRTLVQNSTCVIHVAGPYLNEEPLPLRAAIASSNCKVYVDVSDPLDFIQNSLDLNDEAVESGTSALLSAGAFPGMSNVLAMEAASSLPSSRVKDVRFNYFTAGLGGSGDVNLYITNLGFGEAMGQYRDGTLAFFERLSGCILGKVSFFLPANDDDDNELAFGNQQAKSRIGTKTVFAWPFPEAATTPRELEASGSSSAAMGTAPEAWNAMLGLLVDIVPRAWWTSERFSRFLADFSKPMVQLTDYVLKITSPDKVGETHAMRVDVVGEDDATVSIVQAHESFRRCVGQSCAEFALDLLENPSPGVLLPERRYGGKEDRERIIRKLVGTKGTIAYSGPKVVEEKPVLENMEKVMGQVKCVEVGGGR